MTEQSHHSMPEVEEEPVVDENVEATEEGATTETAEATEEKTEEATT